MERLKVFTWTFFNVKEKTEDARIEILSMDFPMKWEDYFVPSLVLQGNINLSDNFYYIWLRKESRKTRRIHFFFYTFHFYKFIDYIFYLCFRGILAWTEEDFSHSKSKSH